MNQTEETRDITNSETERAYFVQNNINPKMYSTIDAKASNTRGSWNEQLLRPVKTGNRARAKLPDMRKTISVSNSR